MSRRNRIEGQRQRLRCGKRTSARHEDVHRKVLRVRYEEGKHQQGAASLTFRDP